MKWLSNDYVKSEYIYWKRIHVLGYTYMTNDR